MTQSMSRAAKCIDNGPMEGFWGILKRERYYGLRFTSKKELVGMIVEKAVNMAKMMNIPVLGIVENMSWVSCPDCGKKIYPFGKAGQRKLRWSTACRCWRSCRWTPDWRGSAIQASLNCSMRTG